MKVWLPYFLCVIMYMMVNIKRRIIMNVELNISELLDRMSQEIANLIRQVYVKDAEIAALRKVLAESSEKEVSE